jgi:hypothetical protein
VGEERRIFRYSHGGTGLEQGYVIAVDQGGNSYVTGNTSEPGLGFSGTAGSPIQSTFAGGSADVFVAKIPSNMSPACSATQAMPTKRLLGEQASILLVTLAGHLLRATALIEMQ